MSAEERPAYEKGSLMLCKTCGTQWWDGTAGARCPSCNPKFAKLAEDIKGRLRRARDEMAAVKVKVAALEEIEISL